MSKPNVLLVNRVSFMGGVERVILTIMDEVAKHGYTPMLACPDRGEMPEAARAKGFEVIPCAFSRMKSSPNPAVLLNHFRVLQREGRHVARICREHDIALMHAHHPVAAMYCVRAATQLNLPLVMHFHETLPLRTLYRYSTMYAAPHAARYICVSLAAKRLVEAMSLPNQKTEVIHNGLDPRFFNEPPSPTPEVTGPGPNIAVFGAIEDRKGQHVFLDAARILAPRFPSAHFWLVGSVPFKDDEAYLRRLRKLAGAEELSGRVTFVSHRPDVIPWMVAMDIVALPSLRFESFGLALIEAMALGKRVIGTDLDGPAEVIRHGDTGLLVPPADPVALADAVSDLLGRPPGDPMGQRAAADARARFSPERFGQQIAEAYAKASAR